MIGTSSNPPPTFSARAPSVLAPTLHQPALDPPALTPIMNTCYRLPLNCTDSNHYYWFPILHPSARALTISTSSNPASISASFNYRHWLQYSSTYTSSNHQHWLQSVHLNQLQPCSISTSSNPPLTLLTSTPCYSTHLFGCHCNFLCNFRWATPFNFQEPSDN